MVKLKLMLATALVVGLSLAFAGSAFAAKASCGACHGTRTGTAVTFDGYTAFKNLRPGFSPAIWEDGKLPVDPDNCETDGRGLHGVHNNYSSASYGKASSSNIRRGNCSYCHLGYKHQSGFVEISGANVTTGRQIYNSQGLDFNSGTNTCANACHRNTATAAPWGNYTSASIALNCNSCHDDVVNKTGLSGAHFSHLSSTVVVGGVLMGAAGNAGCVNCHPDNRNDLWSQGKADDGTVKAYPHASDGTNVVADNATINAGIGATKAGASTTCTNACHTNTSTAMWGDASLACDACHYQSDTPTAAGNDAAVVTLGGSHSAHFSQSVLCSSCHTVPGAGDTSHATALPVAAANATVLASLNFTSGSCSNTGTSCHGTGTTPVWGTSGLGCATCHSYPGVAGRDWDYATTKLNGHTMRSDVTTAGTAKYLTHMKATGYNTLTDTYAGVTADVNSCGRCHAAGSHRSGAVEVSDTHTLGLCSGTSYTFNATTPGSNVTCSNVSCHNGRTTPNWW